MSAQSVASGSRRPRPDSDDVLYTRAIQFSEWARTNIRWIIAGAIVVAVLLTAAIFFWLQRERRQQEAAIQYMAVEQTAASGNMQLAVRDLQAYINRFRGTVYAEEARITLAQIHLQQNDPAKAIEVLKGATERIDDSPVGPQAALLLAAAQQSAGNTQGAVETYLAVAQEADLEFRRNEALENAAMLRAQAGNFAGAVELYQRLVQAAEEGTAEHQLYQMRLAEAQARAEAK